MWELPWVCPTLQKLSNRYRSSSEFEDKLSSLLDGEEYLQCLTDLRGDDLTWLVDSLDKVRLDITHSCSPPKQA